jgi:Ca2+-binding EF-hand superfamily protein
MGNNGSFVIRQGWRVPLMCREQRKPPLRSFLPILLCALALTACGGRQQPPPWMRAAEKPRDENYHGGNAAILLKYDTNHDGTVTRAELIAGLKAEFAAHDTHHNGCLDAEQAGQINQARVDADQSTATPVMDWNQDGCIDYTEFSAAPYSLFDQLDADHDGKLTPKELQRAGAKPREPQEQEPREGPRDGRRRGPADGAGPPPDGEQ